MAIPAVPVSPEELGHPVWSGIEGVPGEVSAEPQSNVEHPWQVHSRHTVGACAGVSIADDRLVVLVNDRASDSSGTLASLLPDGTARVQCQAAPQALYLRHGEPVLVPQLPGVCEDLPMDEGDLLVLASAGALEHLPRGFGRIVMRLAENSGPEQVVNDVMSYTKAGGVAVISRLPRSA